MLRERVTIDPWIKGYIVEEYTRELGTRNDKHYFLHVEAEPDYNDPDTFAVVLYYNSIDGKTGEERTVEVVRIENKAHGQVHIDQEYLPNKPKDFDVDYTFYEAWTELQENWETYAKQHDRHHT
jgi:hypothetical protein